MTSAKYWDGIERRKARPSRDSIIDLLNRFGTEYPEPEKNAADYRKMYYDLLARPWTPRGSGLPNRTVRTIAALAGGAVFLVGGMLLYSPFLRDSALTAGTILPVLLGIGIWGSAVAAAALFVLSRLSINFRTRAHAFRAYPAVGRAARQLTDSSKGETIRDYLPVVFIDGKPFFHAVYVKKGDAAKIPTGIAVLDDRGRVLRQYGILENTKLTASICIICGDVLQQRADRLRASMKHVIDRRIPRAYKALKNQEQQFSAHGLADRWKAVLEATANLPQALRESITILDGEEDFRRAMGYGSAVEFHLEDARKLRELYLAYVKFLNAAYRRKVISLTTEAAMLISILESKTDWRDKDAALSALSTLAVAGTNSFLARICQKEYEGIVNEEDRTAYEKKTNYAEEIGWPVVSE